MKVDIDDLHSRQRLGFQEIVPGPQSLATDEQDVDWIPEFDLDHQMMARHRRATAQRRRAPAQRIDSEPKPTTMKSNQTSPPQTVYGWLNIKQTSSHVIGEIVAQDIAALCRGERIFG